MASRNLRQPRFFEHQRSGYHPSFNQGTDTSYRTFDSLVRRNEVVSVVANPGGTQLLACATGEGYVATTNPIKLRPKTQGAHNPQDTLSFCGSRPCIFTEHVHIKIDKLFSHIAEARWALVYQFHAIWLVMYRKSQTFQAHSATLISLVCRRGKVEEEP
jgi:hypothetical protein